MLAVDGELSAEVRMEINRLLAFRAPVASLLEARRKMYSIDTVTKTLTDLSDAVRLRLSQSRGLEDTKAILTELSALAKGMASAASSWEELVKEALGPIGLHMTCPSLTCEYEVTFEAGRSSIDPQPVILDLYLVVERATTRF